MALVEIAVAALAMVLVVSGMLKVRDPEATTPMLQAVGLPSSHAAVYAVATAEIVIGAATLVIGGAVATVAVGVLYAGFAALGAVLVRSGAAVSCGCFGQRSSTMTPMHVAVNAVASVVALVGAGLGVTGLYGGSLDGSPGVVAAATLAAGALAAAVVALLTVVPERFGASPSASAAPAFATDAPAPAAGGRDADRGPGAAGLRPVVGVSATGEPSVIEVAGSGRVFLLAFLTTGCTTCSHFWTTFAGLAAADLPGTRTDLVIVTRGDEHENPDRVRELAPADFPVIRSTSAWRDYGIDAGPYFVLLDGRRDVVLGEGGATSWIEVDGLVRQAVGIS